MFCKNGELVYRCANDPHHVWEDGVRLTPFRRSLPGCLSIEQRQGLDIYMPTAVTGDTMEEYVPVFLVSEQSGDITNAFNQWTGLCPPTDDHDCCVKVYFSFNYFDFSDNIDSPGFVLNDIEVTGCKPACSGENRIYVNSTAEWMYRRASPSPSDTLVRAFYTGRRAPNILPGYEALSLYQFMTAATGMWFGLINAQDRTETQECSHHASVMENPGTYDDAIDLTPQDICQFRKLYCDHSVGLDVDEAHDAAGLSLSQNIPNPFSTMTAIPYSLAKPGHLRLSLYNAQGEEIRTLLDQRTEAGTYTFGFHADHDVPPGTYWYVLKVDDATHARQMILVR
jgi:hypothetical protein